MTSSNIYQKQLKNRDLGSNEAPGLNNLKRAPQFTDDPFLIAQSPRASLESKHDSSTGLGTSRNNMRRIILGVDPGTVVTGYALVCYQINQITPLDFGCIRPPKNDLLSLRYHIIFKSLLHLIGLHGATEMAIETPFVHKNPQSAIKLGSALGCAIIAAKEHGLPIFPYSPRAVKQGITRTGSATKEQVACFIKAQLHLNDAQMRLDATDALSIAVYHARNPLDKNLKTVKEL